MIEWSWPSAAVAEDVWERKRKKELNTTGRFLGKKKRKFRVGVALIP